MRFFGFELSRSKKSLQSVDSRAGWWPIIRESFTGAWQRNIEINNDEVTTFHADFACKTLIARDIAKLRVKLMREDDDGIWTPTSNPAYDPVLRRPNHYQTRNQFWESWFLSKLARGNTYVLKGRDNRNVVNALYVLDPSRCSPLVADDGSVFYRLTPDSLSGLGTEVTVPAREIIHDRMNCLFHPLVGLPPVFASALAATQGLNIQANSVRLFGNNSAPGGILTAPGAIQTDTANRLKADWENNFSGKNVGRVAVLGDGLKYERMVLTAVEGQMIEQLKWTAEVVCSTYHVPPYKIGIGLAELPSAANVQALNLEYFSQALQSLIEEAEECLDHGLSIGYGTGLGVEFDTDNLMRMDSVTQMTVLQQGIAASVLSPNEARKKLDLRKVEGGDSPMIQQQNYSLEAIAKRDAQANPFVVAAPPIAPEPANDDATDEEIDDAKVIAAWHLKTLLAA